MTGFVGIEEDYPVSIKEVLNITAETGAMETQYRVRQLPHYAERTCEYIFSKGTYSGTKNYKCSKCGDSFSWTQNEFFPLRFNYCRYCGAKVVGFVEKEKEDG